jgi:hypothetical protein
VNTARIAVFVVIALAVTVSANLILLGIANGPREPVGQLTPRAGIVKLPPPSATTTLPTSRPSSTTPAGQPGRSESRGSQQDD